MNRGFLIVILVSSCRRYDMPRWGDFKPKFYVSSCYNLATSIQQRNLGQRHTARLGWLPDNIFFLRQTLHFLAYYLSYDSCFQNCRLILISAQFSENCTVAKWIFSFSHYFFICCWQLWSVLKNSAIYITCN